MVIKAYIAFYKAPGDWTDKLIRWWTRSPYSHCEIKIGPSWFSCSPRDDKVRVKNIEYKKDHWDLIPIEIDKDYFYKFYNETKGQKYDWVNIFLTQIFHLNIDRKNKWICSEWCATAIKKKHIYKLNPGQLYNYLKDNK